jgi:predicted nucleotidyltransferase
MNHHIKNVDSFERRVSHAIIEFMKVAFIIAEYNPFHLGHAWQLDAARKQLGEDLAFVAIMSGCLTQRGEPAVLDKWSRTRMALACGISLVVELPFAYATASAERFAQGGVGLADATGLNGHLVFGSECGDLAQLQQLAGLLNQEPPEFRLLLRQYLDQGKSFAAARQEAITGLTGDVELGKILGNANNILAVEYLKAMGESGQRQLVPLTFQRQGQAYLDHAPTTPAEGFASAASIRRLINNNRCHQRANVTPSLFSALTKTMPPSALAVLLEKIRSGPGPLGPEDLAEPIIGRLRGLDPSQLDQIPGMHEGLGRRLAAAAARPGKSCDQSGGRLEILLSDAATKRFPRTRIQRALMAMLAGLRQEDLSLFDQHGGPQYLRILGFDKKGRHLLKIMRKQAKLPILMNMSDRLEHKNDALLRMAELDGIATDLWMLAAGKRCGLDFDTPPVMR